MRSCEYSTVSGERKTKRLTLNSIRFFTLIHGTIREINHSSTEIYNADVVSITFVFQKNGEKEATITQHQSKNQLCPVKPWASKVTKIRSYPGSKDNTPVNTYLYSGKLNTITSTQVLHYLKLKVSEIGAKILGIDINRVGTHSLRTSAAMLLYLAEVRTSTIMLLGRWKSDAFLLYLRRQVKEFTQGVTTAMTSQPNMFFQMPGLLRSQQDDPRIPHTDSIASINNFNRTIKCESGRPRPTFRQALKVWG